MANIIVVGSLNMDLVVKAPRMPVSGETISGEDLHTIPGGKGANQAAAASKMEADVAMVGRVGKDNFGPMLIENLSKLGVDTQYIITDETHATGTAVIIVDSQGQNCIVLSPGANGKVTKDDIDRIDSVMSKAKILLLQFEIPMDVVFYAMERAKKNGLMVILNPAPAYIFDKKYYKFIDYLILNETELQMISDMDISGDEGIQLAAKKIMQWGAKKIIVTLGKRGACIISESTNHMVKARKVDAVDSTGAGDAFIGGFAVSMIKGKDEIKAVEYGCSAGSFTVTRFGAQPSLPTKKELESWQ
jgi:ribokinase